MPSLRLLSEISQGVAWPWIHPARRSSRDEKAAKIDEEKQLQKSESLTSQTPQQQAVDNQIVEAFVREMLELPSVLERERKENPEDAPGNVLVKLIALCNRDLAWPVVQKVCTGAEM